MARPSMARHWFGGALVGAGLIWFLDGALGSRRRARIRDKANALAHRVEHAVGPTARDLSNRLTGIAAGLKPQSEGPPDYHVLEARVRSELGRCVSYPHAIKVVACEGRVRLSGPILASEMQSAVGRVQKVRGVKEVENLLEPHEEPAGVPGLQGKPSRREPASPFMQSQWAPAPRLLAGMAGTGLTLLGMKRGGLAGIGAASAGAALLARAVTIQELAKLSGIESGEGSRIDIQKTININASPEKVFSLWSNLHDLPRCTSHVKKVEDRGDGHSHWTISGPAGLPAEFTAQITECVPNRVLAWKTDPGSKVHHQGKIRFDPSNGGTRVHVQLSYSPPGGYLGHMLASAIGSDPKTMMDEDFTRIKTYVERRQETGVRRQE